MARLLIPIIFFIHFSIFGKTKNQDKKDSLSQTHHPQLIITKKNINTFQLLAKDENQNLFNLAEKLAVEFNIRWSG